jgi:uridine kinase
MKTIIVGIAGGTGSGKSTLAAALAEQLAFGPGAAMTQDNYYRGQAHLDVKQRAEVNFDHPDAIDFELLAEHLACLRDGRAIETPTYDFTTHLRTDQSRTVHPAPVLIVEGILLFHGLQVRDLLDLRVFVEATDPVRLERRIARDVRERGRTEEDVRTQYEDSVRPMHNQFVEPQKTHAHLIVDGEAALVTAVTQILEKVEALGRS